MSSPSAPKDKFFKRVINPYLAEVLQHPQTIEMREGVLHIRDVEGPRRTGSMETKLEAVEQQVFKCQGMVEPPPLQGAPPISWTARVPPGLRFLAQ